MINGLREQACLPWRQGFQIEPQTAQIWQLASWVWVDCPQERDGKRGAGKGETGTFPASPCTSGGVGWGGFYRGKRLGWRGRHAGLLTLSACLGRKGEATTPGDWQMSGLIFKAVSSPLSKAFLMSFTSTWDPDTRKIPSCWSPRKTGNSDQGDKKANSQLQRQA